MDSKDLVSLIAAIVPGVLVAWIAGRLAAKSQTKTTQETVAGQIKVSKEQAETDAFTRAADMYDRTIKRLEAELADALADIERLEARVQELQTHLGQANSDKAALTAELAEVRRELNQAHLLVESLRSELHIATSLLQQRFPDDDDHHDPDHATG